MGTTQENPVTEGRETLGGPPVSLLTPRVSVFILFVEVPVSSPFPKYPRALLRRGGSSFTGGVQRSPADTLPGSPTTSGARRTEGRGLPGKGSEPYEPSIPETRKHSRRQKQTKF